MHRGDSLGRFAIIAAMAEELAALRRQLTDEQVIQMAGLEYIFGDLQAIPVVLSRCGIGKVNAAMGTAVLCQMFSPVAVVNTGSAGALSSQCQIGDIVLGSAVCYHDVDATVFGYQYGQVPSEPPQFEADSELLEMGQMAANEVVAVQVHTGVIASGDSFMDDPEKVARIHNLLPDVMAAEMEAAAIAQVCRHFGVPSLIVRAISDVAGANSRTVHEEFLEQAAVHSAALVMGIIRQFAAKVSD